MNRKGDKSLIVGLDIGTSKVTALVGEYSPGHEIEVIGIGSHESRGLRRGVEATRRGRIDQLVLGRDVPVVQPCELLEQALVLGPLLEQLAHVLDGIAACLPPGAGEHR